MTHYKTLFVYVFTYIETCIEQHILSTIYIFYFGIYVITSMNDCLESKYKK